MADNLIAERVHRIRSVETSDYAALSVIADKQNDSNNTPASIRSLINEIGNACIVATQATDAKVVGGIIYQVTDHYFRIRKWLCDIDNEHAAIILRDLIDALIMRLDRVHSKIYLTTTRKHARLRQFVLSIGFRDAKEIPGGKEVDGDVYVWRLNIPSTKEFDGRGGYYR